MEIVLASPRGFCAGVVRAIHTVRRALEIHEPPVYIKHQIVHNPTVVQELEQIGAITVDQVDQVPEGATVIFSAHGSPPSDYATARERNLKVIDATCPLVTRVHNEAKKYQREGKRIMLIGHKGHQEVIGSQGYAEMHLLDDRHGGDLPDWEPDEEVAILTQTTLSVDDTANAIERARKKFANLTVRNDICYATTNRQEAAKQIAEMVDVFIVIGSSQSSNCMRLKEIAESYGLRTFRINSADALDLDWLKPDDRIGITSSASTPEKTVEEVIRKINPAKITRTGAPPESIVFSLPKELG